jgi:hypothetical protein
MFSTFERIASGVAFQRNGFGFFNRRVGVRGGM